MWHLIFVNVKNQFGYWTFQLNNKHNAVVHIYIYVFAYLACHEEFVFTKTYLIVFWYYRCLNLWSVTDWSVCHLVVMLSNICLYRYSHESNLSRYPMDESEMGLIRNSWPWTLEYLWFDLWPDNIKIIKCIAVTLHMSKDQYSSLSHSCDMRATTSWPKI